MSFSNYTYSEAKKSHDDGTCLRGLLGSSELYLHALKRNLEAGKEDAAAKCEQRLRHLVELMKVGVKRIAEIPARALFDEDIADTAQVFINEADRYLKEKEFDENVQDAVYAFHVLALNKWPVKLALECIYDTICDKISKDDFIKEIQKTILQLDSERNSDVIKK